MAKEAKAKEAGVAQPAGVKPGTELTEAQRTSLAQMQEQFAADAGAGFEETNANSFAIPFLYILQSGSPQCKRSEVASYIEGAEEGMLLDTVLGEIFEARVTERTPNVGVLFVPVHYAQRYIEWKPRESGGGFVQEHPPTTPLVGQTKKDAKNRDVLPNGNNLVDTRNHYGLLIGAFDKEGQPIVTDPRPMVISMSSTQVKKSRNWMSKMSGMKIKVGTVMKPAPMYANVWRFQTVPEKNDQGAWFGWKIEHYGQIAPELMVGAREFRDAVLAGRAQTATPPGGDNVMSEAGETIDA